MRSLVFGSASQPNRVASVGAPALVFCLVLAACSGPEGRRSALPGNAAGFDSGGAQSAGAQSAGAQSAGAQNGGAPGAGAAGNDGGSVQAGGSAGNENGNAAGNESGGAPERAGSGGGSAGKSGAGGAGATGTVTWKAIPAGTSWQWQLSGKLDTSFAVKVYDIDLFDNDAATVAALHAKGVQVICYMSVGSYEDWRPDAADFPAAVLGKDYPGWPGEKFLDIRALDKLGPIMQKRLDSCASKGFDGIEPDNMDVFEGGTAGTSFPLTEKDGLAYARWLTEQAHARGLSIGQKNTSELSGDLATVMDWALTEDCFDGNWCDAMQPYIDHGKAVLMSEYTDTGVNFGSACSWAKAHQFSAILKGRDLDAPVQFCP